MGRLIDADKLLEAVGKSLKDNPHKNSVHSCCHVHEHNHFFTMIAEHPTAYDVEAVVEEVQDIGTRFCTTVHCNNECENCDHGSIMKAVIDAIRKGGVK